MIHTSNDVSALITHSRSVERTITGRPASDGAGVRLTRVIDQALQRRLDPFLMLDSFRNENAADYIGGFPDHPHRGFETITYMLAGRMRHRDSAGNEGLLEPGSVQWMTAGRGVIHSEMPEQQDGLMEGFQLWLNLPAADKMSAPWYRDIGADELPKWRGANGPTVVIIAGEFAGVQGAVQRPKTAALYLDVQFEAPGVLALPIAPRLNACLYVYRGSVSAGTGAKVGADTLAILDNAANADGVRISADAPARLLVLAGQPLNEPVVQYGPFVMNSREQIMQAINDYQTGAMA